MMEILSLDTGWTECDICGSGEGGIVVGVADLEEAYDFHASHRCYGRESRTGISRDELLERIRAWDHIVRTRRARAAIRDFCRRVERGKFCPEQQALSTPQRVLTFLFPQAEEEALSFASAWSLDPTCNCSLCQRGITAPIDPSQTVPAVSTDPASAVVAGQHLWFTLRSEASQEDEPF